MSDYSIRDLERLTGIKAHTIRIWEKRYSIVQPQRTHTNIRFYTEKDLKKLMCIGSLTRNGYRISELSSLSDSELSDLVATIGVSSDDEGFYINDLMKAMISVDKELFEKILGDIIMRYGFEDALLSVILPFFENANYLWQRDKVNTAQQYFALGIVRQQIIVAIHQLVLHAKTVGKTFLLFLPEGENNEINLLFYYYILKKQNHRVIYLGPDIPTDDLVSIGKLVSPDYLLTVYNREPSRDAARAYLKELSSRVPDFSILASGGQVALLYDDLPKNIMIFRTLFELKGMLSTL